MIYQPSANAQYFQCVALYSAPKTVYSIGNIITSMDEQTTSGYENAKEYCHDIVPTSSYYAGGTNADLIGVRVAYDYEITSNTHQVYALSSVASQLTCSNSSPVSSSLAAIASFLPQSPEEVRIPNIISNLVSEGTLASQLAIELYSAVWQYLGLLTFFKMIKVFKP